MTAIEYNVIATLQLDAELLSDPVVDILVDSVALYHGTVSPSALGYTELVFTLNAESYEQASDLAASVLYHSIDYSLRALQILPTEDYDALVDAQPSAPHVPKSPVLVPPPIPAPPKSYSVVEAAAALGVTRQRVLQLINSKVLPADRVGKAWNVPVAVVAEYKAKQEAKKAEANG